MTRLQKARGTPEKEARKLVGGHIPVNRGFHVKERRRDGFGIMLGKIDRWRLTGHLALGFLVLAASGAVAVAQPPLPAPDPQATAKFEAFVHDFRDTALKAGIAAQTYDRSMTGIALNPRVQQLNLQQPEFVKPVWDYLDSAVSADRISKGQQMLAATATPLANIEQRFGVPKEILVAIWGDESNYGAAMGSFNMFEALSTLAYDGPRSEFARRELINALKMEVREHYDPQQMTSSWAGAFGQTQFVPSAFLQYAIDGDGDGRVDLWHSAADALASSANLLQNAGWEKGNVWGYEVTLPADFAFENADIDRTKSLNEWRKLGITTANGAELQKGDTQAAVITPAGARGPAFIVLDNFRVVLKYNNAVSYALAICTLADRLRGGAPVIHPWPREEVALTRDELVAFQSDLKRLGYDPGDADGIFGRKARSALRAYQKAHGLTADGFATQDLLVRMEREIVSKPG
jgi:membrane-bound lytic murein transglycosylase B